MISQTTAPQQIRSNGTTVEMLSFRGAGSGETTIDLGALVPTASKMAVNGEMQARSAGQEFAMVMDLVMTLASR